MTDVTQDTTTQETPAPRRPRHRWSWSVGERGQTALVFVERNGRMYGQLGGRGGRRAALGWSDSLEGRERARNWAREQHRQLADGLLAVGDPVPTCAKIFAAYAAARADVELDTTSAQEDRRCPVMFTRVFGGDRDLSRLPLQVWEQFLRQRQTGAIDPQGRPVPEPQNAEDPPRRPVRARTVESDAEWLWKVLAWATEADDPEGRPLLRVHPLKRERFRAAIPRVVNPRRPVATQDRYEALLAVADQVHPYLGPLLALVNGTGRRIGAVTQLRYADLQLAKRKSAPHGAIAWPGETDKMGKAWSAPLNAAVRATLDALLAARPGLGAAYLFPAPKNAGKPVDRWLASKWLEEAQLLAKLPRLDGSLWHAYRRKWATERKHLPVQDVAMAGGWTNAATLQLIYQQPDEGMLYRVVSEPAELREVKA